MVPGTETAQLQPQLFVSFMAGVKPMGLSSRFCK